MASSIIDNQADNTLLDGLKRLSADGHELSIATAFFSLNALLLLADTLTGYQRIRILFGDDADAQQRRKLLEMLRLRSDAELLKQRQSLSCPSPPHLSESPGRNWKRQFYFSRTATKY